MPPESIQELRDLGKVMTEHAPGDGQWKQKYFAQLEKFEREEKNWYQTEDVLKRTLSRVSLAAEGLTAELDEQLSDMRDALRQHVNAASLQGQLQRMSDALLELEGRSGERMDRSSARSWESVIERLPWPRDLRRDAKRLRKQITKVHYTSDLVPLLGEIETLLAHAIQVQSEATPAREGWLARIFKKTSAIASPSPTSAEVNVTPSIHSAVSIIPAVSTSESAALLEPLLDFAEERFGVQHAVVVQLAEKLDQANALSQLKAVSLELTALLKTLPDAKLAMPITTITSGNNARSPNGVLIELLERLSLPAELDQRIAALREQLLVPVPSEQWPHVLQGFCDLVADMRRKVQREKEDLEKFLSQLTTRLQELDEKVKGTRDEHEASFRHGQVLDMAVKEQVSSIASSMQGAAQLDNIKQSIQDRLEEIRHHMDAYREAEKDRHRQADEHTKALTNRLHELEQEAELLRERVREQRGQALKDTLTGIHNRLAYDERVEQEYLRWKRFKEPVTVMVWDVDDFKKVNDTYGHKAGDKVLVAIAKLLASQIRETDFIARYGGEEFVIIAPGTDTATALVVAEKLRTSIEQKSFRHHNVPVPVTISCGIAEFRSEETPDTVFEKADEALYSAKLAGRNRCVIASVGT